MGGGSSGSIFVQVEPIRAIVMKTYAADLRRGVLLTKVLSVGFDPHRLIVVVAIHRVRYDYLCYSL